MKIREGFVSNSSSSSFIISGPIFNGKVVLVPNRSITNEEQLTEYMDSQYGEAEWDNTWSIVKEAKKAFSKGHGVALVDVEYGGEEFFERLDKSYNSVTAGDY